ncbi:MAG: epoxyqueuosine reductase QueH [Ruminococcus sp.]|nr:epoxyqueuosine reductase QueH [Ruminococcus sp.]
MNTNAQKNMDRMIGELQAAGKAPTLLIHACCAPCSSYVLEYLSEYFNIIILYYNPNITNPEEYEYRLSEETRLISELPHKHSIRLIKGDYEPERFFGAVKGLEKEPEGGKRCEVCFELRLREAARVCAEQGADYFLTTLTISPLKNAAKINKIGEKIAAEYGVKYLPSDFKKKNGYKRSIELSREYNLYRQNYCGCVFSRKQLDN